MELLSFFWVSEFRTLVDGRLRGLPRTVGVDLRAAIITSKGGMFQWWPYLEVFFERAIKRNSYLKKKCKRWKVLAKCLGCYLSLLFEDNINVQSEVVVVLKIQTKYRLGLLLALKYGVALFENLDAISCKCREQTHFLLWIYCCVAVSIFCFWSVN